MRSYSSREVIELLKADGWYEVSVTGSHHQLLCPPGSTPPLWNIISTFRRCCRTP